MACGSYRSTSAGLCDVSSNDRHIRILGEVAKCWSYIIPSTFISWQLKRTFLPSSWLRVNLSLYWAVFRVMSWCPSSPQRWTGIISKSASAWQVLFYVHTVLSLASGNPFQLGFSPTQSRVSDSFLLSGTVECSQVLNVLSCYVASTISPCSIGCFEWEMVETITQAPGVSSPSRSRFPGLFGGLR